MQEIEKGSHVQEMKEKHHIAEEMWIALKQDTISRQEYMQILEHTGECTWCASRLAECMTDDADVSSEPPSYLAEQILERTKHLDVQASVTIRETSRRVQLLLYSLKVGAAVAFSLLVLGVTANFRDVGFTQLERPVAEQEQQGRQEESVLDKMSQAADGVAEKMNEFADLILNGGNKE